MLQFGYQWVYAAFYLELAIIFIIGVFKSKNSVIIYDSGIVKENSYSKFLAFLFLIPITVVSACRTDFIDTKDYIRMFKYSAPDFSTVNDDYFGDVEKGFLYFLGALKRITDDPQILFIVSSIFIYIIVIYFIFKNSSDVPFALWIYMCLSWTGSMNGIRQYMAAVFVCAAWTIWSRKGKNIKNDIVFILLIVCSMQFHKSAFICIIVFFLARGRLFNPGMILVYLGTILLYVFPGLYSYLFETIFSGDSYSSYENVESSMGFMRFLVASVPMILIIINYYVDKEGTRDSTNITNWMMNACSFAFCCSLMATKMVFFARLNMYFSLFNVVMIPTLVNKIFRTGLNSMVKVAAYILYFIYFLVQMNAYGGYMEKFQLFFLK